MSYVVNTTGWIVGEREMTLGETVPDDVLDALGDLEPFLDGGYIRPAGGTARVPVSPITGQPVTDAALPADQSASTGTE